jgi:energy-converting hydrogenase Eha subunit C
VALSFSRHLLADIGRIFSFTAGQRIVPDSRGIFQWQSTLANVACFTNIGLFLYILITERGYSLPLDLEGSLLWAALFAGLSFLITARHITSFITGAISGRPALFSEYLNNIYSLYRLLGIAILPVVVAIAYLNYFETAILLKAGVTIIILVFIIRIISLLIIFMRSNISIFYFILYLCALEIMPGAILFRVITA